MKQQKIILGLFVFVFFLWSCDAKRDVRQTRAKANHKVLKFEKWQNPVKPVQNLINLQVMEGEIDDQPNYSEDSIADEYSEESINDNRNDILTDILKKYDPSIVPRRLFVPVTVNFRMFLHHLFAVNQMDETVEVGLDVFLLWRDRRLRYNKEKLPPRTNFINVDPTLIWTPKLEILNVIDQSVRLNLF